MAKKELPAKTNPETLMLAYLCIKDEDGLVQRVAILDRFGISDTDMAIVCGVALQSIRDARQKRKKDKPNKGSRNSTLSKEKQR